MELNNEDIQIHSILAKVNIRDPEQFTLRLFELTDHQSMRLFIYRMLTAAFSKDKWADGTGAQFLQQLTYLEMAINIACAMDKARKDGQKVFPYIPPPKSALPHEPSTFFQFCNIAPMLTLHELSAPQITFRKFFEFANLEDWKLLLKDIVHCAAGHEDYRDLGKPFPSLLLFSHLSKLVDAVQVVHLGYQYM